MQPDPTPAAQDRPTLYQEADAAGLIVGAWQSDLYLLDTPEARDMIARHGLRGQPFRATTGEQALDVAFANDRFWESRS